MGSLLTLIRGQPQNNNELGPSQVHFSPRNGCYFGSYFIMGGEQFNTGGNDSYLFGEPNDLTFLNRRPASFPYPAPAASEPSKTLQSIVNIRRDSVKLIRSSNNSDQYSLEFILDSDAACTVRVVTSVREDGMVSIIRDQGVKTWSFKSGLGQLFKVDNLVFLPGAMGPTMFKWGGSSEPVPLVIHVQVDGDYQNHSHTVLGVFESTGDCFTVKVLKQKQIIDGISFILQEIYGMEGKADKSAGNGECVVCLSAPRDTMILPCRHLCLCHSCADDVRYKSNVCLMCRQPFRALLRIEALQRMSSETDTGSEQYEPVDLVPYTKRSSSVCSSHISSIPLETGDEIRPCSPDYSLATIGTTAATAVEELNTNNPSIQETSLTLPDHTDEEEKEEDDPSETDRSPPLRFLGDHQEEEHAVRSLE